MPTYKPQNVKWLIFPFQFSFQEKTPHSVLFCGMAIFVHLCWTFRVLYLGPILSSFTESEKTLTRNHFRHWPSSPLLRMRYFFSCKLILAKGVLWWSCLSFVINADLQPLQQLKHSFMTVPTATGFILLRNIHYSISNCISKCTPKLICDLLSLYQLQ